jgi:phosphatidylethanolamine/phosphatidyl-N-methylethanolamine N-methyltransferase
MTDMSHAADFGRFFLSWLSSPLRVAAVAPSGKALARLMTMDVTDRTGPVLELGPGTGVFTRALLERGIREEDLTLIEFGGEFVDILEKRFRQARVLRMDAAELLHKRLYAGRPVGVVLSGLPLLSMPNRKVTRILNGALEYMRADGAFYQFTYGRRCPISDAVLEQLGLEAERIGRTIFNIPPAAVYRITRKAVSPLTL